MGALNIDLRDIHSIGERTREHIVTAKLCPGLSTYGIRLAGKSDARSGFRFVRVRPDFAQILACVAGEGRVFAGGEWQRLGVGSAYLTPPHVSHRYEVTARQRWSLVWVMYDHTAADSPGAGLKEPRLVSTDAQALGGVLDGLVRELNQGGDQRVLEHWTALLHLHAVRAAAPPASDPRLVHLWQEVRGRLADRWDLPALAAEAGISTEHLRRLCHEEHGESPLRYLTRLRMRHAVGLLALPPYTVERVAELVGYDNPFAFSTAFKRVIGHPPSRLRGSAR